MTKGDMLSSIISFAIPLLFGSLLQTLYNTVDSVVIGNFVGTEALAAVGACYSPMMLLLAVMMGLSGGVSVLVSQAFGSGDVKRVREVVATASGFFLISVVPITLCALLMIKPVLAIIDMPAAAMEHATVYLLIVFGGLFGAYGYNLNSGLLRGLGDSRSPLVFLVIACLVNIVLDLFFVLVMGWGVFGVAIATVTAQIVSWLYSLVHIKRHFAYLDFRLFSLRIGGGHLKRLLSLSFPMVMNHAFFSLGFLLYYRFVNGFGPDFMAGYSIAGKVENLTWLPVSSLGMAAITFAGQNSGAGNLEWLGRGVKVFLKTAISVNVFAAVVTLFFGRQILGLFSPDAAVVDAGFSYLACVMPFYWIYAVVHILSSFMNGVGYVRAPALITMVMFWCVRLPVAWYLSLHASREVLHYSFPISWAVACVLTVSCFALGRWKRGMTVRDADAVDNKKPPPLGLGSKQAA